MTNIGGRIKEFRKQKGLTQALLAKQAGISRSYLADVEANRYNPSVDTLIKISFALGVPVSSLMGDDNLDFWNLHQLCEKNEIPLGALGKLLGIPQEDLDAIRTNQLPSEETINKICEYFDCTFDYLSGRVNSPDQILLGEKLVTFPKEENSHEGLTTKVPILGSVAAGQPLYAEQNILGYEEVPAALVKGAEYFFLRVKGDSMIGSRIYPGDQVLIRRQSTVEDDQIALVLVNGEEATLKRVKYVDGRVILYPDNPAYEPMVYPAEDVKITGLVVRVFFDPNSKKSKEGLPL